MPWRDLPDKGGSEADLIENNEKPMGLRQAETGEKGEIEVGFGARDRAELTISDKPFHGVFLNGRVNTDKPLILKPDKHKNVLGIQIGVVLQTCSKDKIIWVHYSQDCPVKPGLRLRVYRESLYVCTIVVEHVGEWQLVCRGDNNVSKIIWTGGAQVRRVRDGGN
jgi:hypothetical protein